MKVMIPTYLPCTDVGIYHCLVALLIVMVSVGTTDAILRNVDLFSMRCPS
jgi:hypothetical protein